MVDAVIGRRRRTEYLLTRSTDGGDAMRVSDITGRRVAGVDSTAINLVKTTKSRNSIDGLVVVVVMRNDDEESDEGNESKHDDDVAVGMLFCCRCCCCCCRCCRFRVVGSGKIAAHNSSTGKI